ncbi:hypothetical protein BU25DRAFT_311740, partial [Macroventuria anomochaeta]
LWIDATCIDQTNVKGKGQQVQQVGLTYAGADIGFIWLSLDDHDESALRQLNWMLPIRANPTVSTIYLTDLLSQVTESEYWSRAWIAQEVVLARSPVIYV